MFANYRFYRVAWLITALCAIGWTLPVVAAEKGITPNEVFSEALQIEKEINLLKRHYNLAVVNSVAPIETDLQPRHIWQTSYVVLLKLNIFRHKHGLQGVVPIAVAPAVKLEPTMNWGQMLRILTELMIIKNNLGISGEVTPASPVQDKRPIDVFNKLNQIAYEMDVINGEPISTSYVYAEALRFNEDVNSILRESGISDAAVPPPNNPNATPQDSLNAAVTLMEEVLRLQRQLGLATTDFSAFHKTEKVLPSDALNMVTLGLAELQVIKARLGMEHTITPAAEFYEGKTPTQVVQLLGYVTNKLRLVKVR
jgi:hypothetical protein